MHAITEALLAVAAVIGIMIFVSIAIVEVSNGGNAVTASSQTGVERVRSDFDIVFVAGDAATPEVIFWANNTGTVNIDQVEASNLILNTPSGPQRIPHGSGAEFWTYIIEDGEPAWTPGTTIKVTVSLASLPAGFYQVVFSVPNGVTKTGDFVV